MRGTRAVAEKLEGTASCGRGDVSVPVPDPADSQVLIVGEVEIAAGIQRASPSGVLMEAWTASPPSPEKPPANVPEGPIPAMVLLIPFGATFRIRLLVVSEI